MPQLYMLTVPDLEVTSDWRAVHDRLLDDFGQIEDVLATTMPETLLITYHGVSDVDGWLEHWLRSCSRESGSQPA
jgi:hypothetical protein